MFALGHEMDVRDLSFCDETFDVAIDKGTMDAMMTAKGDVWVSLIKSGTLALLNYLSIGSPTTSYR